MTVFVTCNRSILAHRHEVAESPGRYEDSHGIPLLHFKFPLIVLTSHTPAEGVTFSPGEGAPSILVKPAAGDIYFPEQEMLVGSPKCCLLSL